MNLDTLKYKWPLLLPLAADVKLLLLFHENNKGKVGLVWSGLRFVLVFVAFAGGQTNSLWHIDSFEGECNHNNNIPNKIH